jgi:hypothetical protein
MWPFRKFQELGKNQKWQVDTFRWLVQEYGADTWKKRELLYPRNDLFPTEGSVNHDLASLLFEFVKEKSMMQKWETTLVAQYELQGDGELPPDVPVSVKTNEPQGTFIIIRNDNDGTCAKITYNPSSLKNPVDFIATMAHELSHYLNWNKIDIMPGGGLFHEYATDMTAIYMGWGIFTLRASSRYEQYSEGGMQGHGYRRQGYLSPIECAFGLGLFLEMKNIDYRTLSDYFSRYHYELIKKSIKTIRRSNCLELGFA